MFQMRHKKIKIAAIELNNIGFFFYFLSDDDLYVSVFIYIIKVYIIYFFSY